jgi:signal transduction histidine kinase
MVIGRSAPKATEHELAHGIPVFLDQLIRTLKIEQTSALRQNADLPGNSGNSTTSKIGEMAALHGRDLFEQGFSIEQVVRDYGDVCQVITQLADETSASIKIDEFRTLNRCLDNAIAGAVSEYACQQAAVETDESFKVLNARLGPLAHELRAHLQTAADAVRSLKEGEVGFSGATGAMLDRSFVRMTSLVDRSLAEVRIMGGLPACFEAVGLAAFLRDAGASASLNPVARRCHFSVMPVDKEIEIEIDVGMLDSAVGNLLQNAFKFTKPQTEVRLYGCRSGDRILISVEDHCGGLPSGSLENLKVPFIQSGNVRSHLGLGLDICRRSAQANGGMLRVRDKPGVGCVFTIDLPRHAPGRPT